MKFDERLIPESRRWFVNTHRTSRVNRLLQFCSNKQLTTLGLKQMNNPNASAHDRSVARDTTNSHRNSIITLLSHRHLRTITSCLFLLWLDKKISVVFFWFYLTSFSFFF